MPEDSRLARARNHPKRSPLLERLACIPLVDDELAVGELYLARIDNASPADRDAEIVLAAAQEFQKCSKVARKPEWREACQGSASKNTGLRFELPRLKPSSWNSGAFMWPSGIMALDSRRDGRSRLADAAIYTDKICYQ